MAETKPVTASVVVDFKSASPGDTLQAELDSRSNGLNNGNTSFEPGDSVGILVYKSVGVAITGVVASAGAISPLGVQSYTFQQDIQFANEKTAQLQYPSSGIVSYKWLGTNGGAPSLQGESSIIIPNKKVAILRLTYTVNPLGYRLAGVPHPLNGETEYPVLIIVTGQGNG